MTTATTKAETDLEAISLPKWAVALASPFPDFLRSLPGQPGAEAERTIASAVEAAGQTAVDWDLARRRILSSLLAEGPHSASETMTVGFWHRRRAFCLVDGVAAALYGNDMQAVAALGDDLDAFPIDEVPLWSRRALAAAGAAADGDVAQTIELVVTAVKEKCEDRRGPGAAMAVALIASAWVAEVVAQSLDLAAIPSERCPTAA